MKKKMTTNVIVTYADLHKNKDLFEANHQDYQHCLDVDIFVTDKDTQDDVFWKIVDAVQDDYRNNNMECLGQPVQDIEYLRWICKISTASNWSVWEELTGKTLDPTHSGKFYFARDPKTMSEMELAIEKKYGWGSHPDAWVPEPTEEEKAMYKEWDLAQQIEQMFADSIQRGTPVPFFDSAEEMIKDIKDKHGSLTEGLKEFGKRQEETA